MTGYSKLEQNGNSPSLSLVIGQHLDKLNVRFAEGGIIANGFCLNPLAKNENAMLEEFDLSLDIALIAVQFRPSRVSLTTLRLPTCL